LRLDDLRDAFVAGAGKTKAFIHCNPHNPTGLMFSETETEEIARLCAEFDVVIVADEVYERCTFDEKTPMTRMADVDVAASTTEPGIATRARTLVVGTASKLLCLSGWRVGWVVGPKPLIAALKTIHAYSTFCAPTPLQLGVAAALEKMADDADAATRARATESASRSPTTTDGTSHDVSGRREAAFACTRGRLVPDAVAEIIASNVAVMSRALTDSGVAPFAPSGGYFLVADVSDTGLDATEYCRALATGPARVAAVPMDVFFDAEGPEKDVPRNLVRFAVCKSSETIGKCAEAIRNNPVGAARK
jgi:aspartate/methionine/tyrosine aminotransferase